MLNLSLVLNDVAKFITSKIEISKINGLNYISTENMLPNKGRLQLLVHCRIQNQLENTCLMIY